MRVKKQNIGFWIYREEPTHTHTTHGVRDDASHPPPPSSLPPFPLMGGGADPIKGRGIDKGEGEEGGAKNPPHVLRMPIGAALQQKKVMQPI